MGTESVPETWQNIYSLTPLLSVGRFIHFDRHQNFKTYIFILYSIKETFYSLHKPFQDETLSIIVVALLLLAPQHFSHPQCC